MAKTEAPRHVKYRKLLGGKLPVPSRIDVHVIGSGGRATPRSVMISTDHVRYLFNCGEGTQRIATEHHLKVSRLENIFITNKTWDNIGGLLGLALTLEATHMPGFTVHGPPEVEKMITMVKGFAESSDIKVEKRELDQEYYEDSAFNIEYVPLYKNNVSLCQQDNITNAYKLDENGGKTSEAPSKKRRLSPEKSEVVVAYICKPFPGVRKVQLEKCVDLGIPRGPLIGKLTSGEAVTLEDGRVIEPDDILSPVEVTKPIVVLECPNLEYLEAVVTSEKLRRHQETEGTEDHTAELVIHSTPASVLNNPKYQEFMARFGNKTKHLILNETTSVLTHEGLYRVQAKLNLLDSKIFPLLPHQDSIREEWTRPIENGETLNNGETNTTDTTADGDSLGCDNIVYGRPLLSYNYRPWKKFLWDQCLSLNNEEFVDEAMQQEGFSAKLEHLKETIKNHSPKSDRPYPEVLFLGTGSSVPNKVRNVSSILVHTDHDSAILLDCGESTAAQIFRHYGSQADDIFQKIQAVYVSHMHADHHLGLFGLLSERQRALAKAGQPLKPILLLAPIQLDRWLKFYSAQIDSVNEHIRLIPLQKILPHKLEVSAEQYNMVLQHLQLTEFHPVEVNHVPNSFGIVITHSSGWKLVYSGDTRPCQRLVKAGLDCDLLIHEATMEDDLIEEAKFKKHSTTSEAIDIGIQMGARFILLNHFSQRYHRIPVINDNFCDKVGITYDNMKVRLSDLEVLPHFIEPLKTMFSEEYSDLADKTFKRTQKKQRKEKKEMDRKQQEIENGSEEKNLNNNQESDNIVESYNPDDTTQTKVSVDTEMEINDNNSLENQLR